MTTERLPRWAVVVLVALLGGLAWVAWSFVSAEAWTPHRIAGVSASSAGRTIDVTVLHAACEHGPRVRVVREEAVAVRLRAESEGSCDDVGLTSHLEVTLGAALGDRTIEVEQPTGTALACAVDDRPADRCVEVPPR